MSLTPVSLPDLADPDLDVAALTATLLDVRSVSGEEGPLADAVEQALRALGGLEVRRFGDAVVARTALGRPTRVILAGHLDTVPLPTVPGSRGTVPSAWDGDVLYGRGAVDMKSGVAVQLALAGRFGRADGPTPVHDVTWVFYDHEEVSSDLSGLARVARQAPELLEGDFAVLLEPTDGGVEGGCKGTLRVDVTTKGIAAHSARPWNGHNAIHDAGEILTRLSAYEPETVTVDGLDYHEALNAVGISGGIAGNVIPDVCRVSVNYRFAPTKNAEEALAHVRGVFSGFDVTLGDSADGALPGLDRPAAQAFVAALGLPVTAKQGWTDVARFSALEVPAVNFGPGDPNLAHTDDERCPEQQITDAEAALRRWLEGAGA